jgi:hypothetical protein
MFERFNRLTDCESFLRGTIATQRNARRLKYHAAAPQKPCRAAEINAQEIEKMGAKSKT